MSVMKYIEELLQGTEVGDVITIEKGKQLNKSLLTERGEYPAYNGGTTFSGFTDRYNYDENKIIVSQGGASAGFVNFITTKFYANAHCYVVLPNVSKVDNKYVYYFLKMNQEILMGKQLGAGIPALRTSEILGISIPIPCPDNPTKSLEIQHKIGEILDKFTALEAELEAELELRKKQYAYYREQLLNFSSTPPHQFNVVWRKLGEVCDFQNGYAFKSRLFKDQGLPIIRITNISGGRVTDEDYKYFDITDYPNRVEEYRISKGDILIAMSGATTGKIGCYDYETPAYLNQRVGRFLPKAEVLNRRFLFHFLQMRSEQLYLMAGGGAQPNLSSNELKYKFEIPLLPLSLQSCIVDILDKFDTLTNSISKGLPKEIELRRKQYEYYRNELLSFSKPIVIA